MNIIDKGLKFTGLNHTNKPTECIIHHASGNGTVEAIHNYHASKGWGGIGYHYYVRKDGSVYKGRPTTAVGCHCVAQGKNRTSIGVCFEGDFEKEYMSEAQKQAGKELCQYIRTNHGLTKFAKHRDYANTDCCGKNFPFEEVTKGTATSSGSTSMTSSGAGIYKVTAEDGLNIRQERSASSKVMGCMPLNTMVEVTNISGNWGEVYYSGIKGFVNVSYVKKVTAPAVSPNKYNEWVARLQKTCNDLKYSNQKVDGYSGKNTLAGCPVLKKGSTGAVVKLLQEHLATVYNMNCNGVDGSFGNGMQSAVKRYQTYFGLDTDGCVGNKTWSKILGL